MKAQEYIKTPRFGTVYIQKVFNNKDEAFKEGYKESTHYENENYGILGKSLDMYHMQFAAYKKWISDEDSLTEEDLDYLHGKCDRWVVQNFQKGDIVIIWNTFNEDMERVCLIHCYIKRGNFYIDVRGMTDNEEKIKENFEDFVFEDNGFIYCKTIDEFKKHIKNICGYDLDL